MNPLAESWLQALALHRRELALVDGPADAHWTFEQLDDAATSRARELKDQRFVFPSGLDAGFVIDTLAAWKSGALVCPLDGTAAVDGAVFDGVPDGICHAKLTSGSTGAPRLILFRPAQLAADPAHIAATMGLDPALPNIGAVSLAHSYGFSNLVLPLLLYGIPLRLAGSPLPEAVRRAMPAAGEVTLPGVPAMWRAWFAAGLVDRRIRIAISAGAPLPVELESDIFHHTGVKLHNFLGSSECGGIAFDRPSTPRTEATLAGTALDGVTLSLDSENRLIVVSTAVGDGCWPPDASSETALGNGRFQTADLAEIRNGAVHLLGRAGDVINIAGRKVHPAEVEAVLRRHPAVRECLVLGLPSGQPDRGDDIAVVIALAHSDATVESIRTWLGTQLPVWKLPRHWCRHDDLSPNERGKFPRREWRDRWLAEGWSVP